MLNWNSGDNVEINGKIYTIMGRYGMGKHSVFTTTIGENIIDLEKKIESGEAKFIPKSSTIQKPKSFFHDTQSINDED